jgi:hypothetical protein
MRIGTVAGAVVLVGAAMAGCGGSGGGGNSPGKSADTHIAKTPANVLSCLLAAGFEAVRHRNAAGVTVTVGPEGRATFQVAFDSSPKEAAGDARTAKDVFGPGGSNTGGGGVASGSVVILYARPQPASSLEKVKRCAF